MLPRPRRRVDPDLVRARLRALAEGVTGVPADADLVDDAGQGAARRVDLHDEGHTSLPAPVVRPVPLRPVLVALAGAALVGWLVLRTVGGPEPSPVELVAGTPLTASPVATGSAVAAPSGAGTPAADLVVHVVGEVRHPGLVELPPGARVADALRAAGGLRPGGGSGGLNLARLVVDGEQILVSHSASPQASVAGSGATTGAGAGAAPVVDLNSATLADLDALPGVGPVLAGRILEWRAAHGRFGSVDQLREVSGVGARTLDRLRPYLRVA